MQKIATPVIFISAVAATLFYVSQEEHDTGTLALLAAVLLVGQICATLPFILEAKHPKAGTSAHANADGNAQKIVANQQIIHEDLRSLGETLIKRLNAISEHQNATEKKLLAALGKDAPTLSDDFDAFREKISKELEERFEDLDKALGEIAAENAPNTEDIEKKLNEIACRLDGFSEILENIASEKNIRSDKDDEDAFSDFDEFDDDEDDISVEDFPEDEAESAPEKVHAEEPPATTQGEFELGDLPRARGATLVLEAMLGIENKPFLRGNAPGLSENAGTPMTFVEIGKWSHDFSALTEEISVRILRNDDENDPLGETITLAPGQKLELAYVPDRA